MHFVDFRALNKITRTYVWPMPRVEAKLLKARFYTTLDIRSGYHHKALDKDSIKEQLLLHHLASMSI